MYKKISLGIIIFVLGILIGNFGKSPLLSPALEEVDNPKEIIYENDNGRYMVNISQSIEYGLIYSKTDTLNGKTQIYTVKDGKLELLITDNSKL